MTDEPAAIIMVLLSRYIITWQLKGWSAVSTPTKIQLNATEGRTNSTRPVATVGSLMI